MRDSLELPAARSRRPASSRPAAWTAAPPGPAEEARARLFAVLDEERSSLNPRRPAARLGVFPTRMPLPARSPGAPSGGRVGLRRRLESLLSQPALLRARSLLRGVRLPLQAVVACVVAYLVLFNFSIVRGSSMSPGIRDGDRILIDQISYLFRDVQRGDVVVMRYPLDPSVDYIKRVVGLPGDHVTIRGAQVFVNGTLLDEPYVAQPDARAHLATIVGPEHFFVLGDNRPHSADSREFGQVPRAYLRGKVDVRVWPFQRVGLID